MQCCKCQKELPDGALFCKYCGARQTPQQKGGEQNECKQAAAAQSPQQPAKTPDAEKPETAQTAEADKVPGSPAQETAEPSPSDPASKPEVQIRAEDSLPAEPEEEPLQPLNHIAAGVPSEHQKLSPEEKTAAAVSDAPTLVLEAQREPLTPEINFQDVTAKPLTAGESTLEHAKEELFFDLDQILPTITPASTDPSDLADKKETPSTKEEEPLLFNLDQIVLPASAVTESPKHEPEAVSPTSKPAEKEPFATQQPMSHDEQEKPSLTMNQHVQRPEPAVPVDLKPQASLAVSAAGPTALFEKQTRKSVKPVLWRVAVIAVELGVIAFLSVRLFF